MKTVDLRSDTVTLPPPEMRRAIAEAELGDDVFRGDPTVNRLEALAAKLMGKEAALLTTSGTQSNLTAMLSHCQRGDEVIVGDEAHILHFEAGGAFALGGLGLRTVRNDEQGRLDLTEVRRAVRGRDVHFPPTGLICVENTHNRCGGSVLSAEDLAAVRALADEYGLPLHLDGARMFNASVAANVPVKEFAAHADTVQFCFSKGLAAPVGSMLVGTRSLIERARKYRKMLGGGMRQAGILAAAALVALETMVDRLAEDHANARLLAEGLAELPGIEIDLKRVQSNIVIFAVRSPRLDAPAFVRGLAARGVLAHQISPDSIRLVTHKDVNREDILAALAAARALLAG